LFAIPEPHVHPVPSRYTDYAIPAPHVQAVASTYIDCAIPAIYMYVYVYEEVKNTELYSVSKIH
jgi:hypothetical protein